MSRRHAVAELPAEQFEFVIQSILDNKNDREISAAFKETFKTRLAKSSLNRWRETAGNELADRYRLARFQAKQLLTDLKDEDADKFQVVMGNIEDRLLTATREVIAKDPVKLLQIRQEEERRRLKVQEIELKREHLDLEREKLRGSRIDRVALGGEFNKDLLEYIGADEEGLRWFKRHAKKFTDFLKEKYAAT